MRSILFVLMSLLLCQGLSAAQATSGVSITPAQQHEHDDEGDRVGGDQKVATGNGFSWALDGLERCRAIVGVGGVFTAEDAWEKIGAGASLIQLYTGFIYEGPSVARGINEGLVAILKRSKFRSLNEAIGYRVDRAKR